MANFTFSEAFMNSIGTPFTVNTEVKMKQLDELLDVLLRNQVLSVKSIQFMIQNQLLAL